MKKYSFKKREEVKFPIPLSPSHPQEANETKENPKLKTSYSYLSSLINQEILLLT